MDTATPDRAALVLDVYICDQQRSYRAVFTDEQAALDFLERRRAQDRAQGHPHGNHTYRETEDSAAPEHWTRMGDLLYPRCPHGLSAELCWDALDHYGPDPDDPRYF